MDSARVVPFAEPWFRRYARFAEERWGAGCYQATRRYVRWLHGAAPAGRRDGDFLLAVQGDAVIGCIHNLRLPWRLPDGSVGDIPTPHNWMVAPQHRHGVGLTLLTGSYARDRHSFVPVADGGLTDLYRKLRFEEVSTGWYRKLLRPVGAGVRQGLKAVFGAEPVSRLHDRAMLRQVPPRREGAFVLDAAPTDTVVADLLQRYAARAPGVAPAWTQETFRWRFFHPLGPPHLALYAPGAAGYALLTLGLRRSLMVGRVIELIAADDGELDALLGAAQTVLRDLGAHVALGYTSDPRQMQRLSALGWSRRDASPAFVYHRARGERFGAVTVGASSADFGFEALATWD